MKKIAIAAVETLAHWVFDAGTPLDHFAWPMIDRIERRFSIQGTAEYFIKQWAFAQAKSRAQSLIRRVQHNPDLLQCETTRMSYQAAIRELA